MCEWINAWKERIYSLCIIVELNVFENLMNLFKRITNNVEKCCWKVDETGTYYISLQDMRINYLLLIDSNP